MDYQTIKEAFLQGEEYEVAQLFNDMLRRSVRAALFSAMEAEVNALCGPRYHPDNQSLNHRAGSEKGVAYLNGVKEEIRRPRVRHETDGEVQLATYAAASSQKGLFDQVVAAVAQGLPIRGAERAMGKAVSKSAASRMWVEKSREQLDLLRNRQLDGAEWLCVILDGVWLHKDICVVVAVGIDVDGNKRVLDFEQGITENATVVASLLDRLSSRGVHVSQGRKMLVLRDGSQAIAKAVQRVWPDAIQQECLVHAHSNARDKVARRDRADLDLHFKKLRESQGKEAGEEAYDELIEFLSERNASAALSLQTRKDALLAFHRLDVPSTLNSTFLNTNLIENTFRNWREATGNVKRWNEQEDMIPRWMASGLLWAEAGFRKVRGYEDLSKLKEALAIPGASSPRPRQAVVSLTTPASHLAKNKGLKKSKK